jgi:phage terminase large subunit-like protein
MIIDAVSLYIQQIESGEATVCEKIRQAYLGIIKPIIDKKSDVYYYDPLPGFEYFCFVEGVPEIGIEPRIRSVDAGNYGEGLKLQLFQKAYWQALLGIKYKNTKQRRFTRSCLIMGRKNGKTTSVAPFPEFVMENYEGTHSFVAATTMQQGMEVWNTTVKMIDGDPTSSLSFTHKISPTPIIECPSKGSDFRVLPNSLTRQDGLKVNVGIIDEFHALPLERYSLLKQGTTAFDEPLMIMISTAGFLRGGLFDDTYEEAQKLLDGEIEDDSFFPVIYELDRKDIVNDRFLDDESCWVKANPGLGTIKSLRGLRDTVMQAKINPNLLSTVKVKDFNIVGVASGSWLTPEQINMPVTISREELKKNYDNSVVIGGFDLSKSGDLTAFTTIIFNTVESRIYADTMYWITDKFLSSTEARQSGVPWQSWIDRGLVRKSGQGSINYKDISAYVMDQVSVHGYVYQKIAYDSWSAVYLVDELAGLGFTKKSCLEPVIQGFKTMNQAMQLLIQLLDEKRLDYLGNPVTKWMLSNVQVEQDRNGNLMPSKRLLKRANKIDGVATLLDCLVPLCENISGYLPGLHSSSPDNNSEGKDGLR